VKKDVWKIKPFTIFHFSFLISHFKILNTTDRSSAQKLSPVFTAKITA